jgi:hypothetical protein
MPTIKNTDYLKIAGESIKTTKEKKESSPLTELFLRFNPERKGKQADALKQRIIKAYEGHQAKYKSRQWVRVLLSVVSFSVAYFWVFKPLAKKEALLAEEYQKFNPPTVAAPAPAPSHSHSHSPAAAVLPKGAPSQAPVRENKYFLEADKQKYVLQDNSIENKTFLCKKFEKENGPSCQLNLPRGDEKVQQDGQYYQQLQHLHMLITALESRQVFFDDQKDVFKAIQSDFLPNYIDKLQDEEQKNSWGKWIEFLAHLYEGPPS